MLCIVLLLASLPALHIAISDRSSSQAMPPRPQQPRVSESYGKLPLAFEENQGQADSSVRYLAHGSDYSLFLTSTAAVLTSQTASPSRGHDHQSGTLPQDLRTGESSAATTLRFSFLGANPDPVIGAEDALPGIVNYFIGNDPAKWHTNIGTAKKVRYHDLYPGIDVVFYGNQGGQWEYDVIVAPGASPEIFAFAIAGATAMTLDSDGSLLLETTAGQMRQPAPSIYQERQGKRIAIAGGFVTHLDGSVGFQVGDYDTSTPLIIDPTTLVYATYLGGGNIDEGTGIAVDSAGSAYIIGTTGSGFPITPSAYQTTYGGGQYDAFVTKLNASGTTLIYSTYLGGAYVDEGASIAVDSAGNAYVTGTTGDGFPTTPGAYQTSGGSTFVTKLNANGTALVYSTYLGEPGTGGAGIAVDGAGNAYVTGHAGDGLPTTPGAYQTLFGGYSDAFVTKLNANGTALIFSTYLGGSNWDEGTGIAVDSAAHVYITGRNYQGGLPTTPGSYQTTNGGGYDAFVAELNATGTALVYSTYLGSSYDDAGTGIAVDSAGSAYITGYSGDGFPITPGAYQTTYGGGSRDVFATKLNANGTALVYSTYLGGSGYDEGTGIAVDSAGNAYVTGNTSGGFPTTPGAYQTTYGGGNDDAFVSELNPSGSTLVYATYLGGTGGDSSYGIAVDSAGLVYITGGVFQGGFPTTPGAYQTAFGGGYDDAFVVKISFSITSTPTITAVSPTSGVPIGGTVVTITGAGFQTGATVTFGGTAATNISVNGVGTSITATTPAHAAGAVDLVITNPTGGSATLPSAFTYYDPTVAGNTLLPIASHPALVCAAGTLHVYAASFSPGCGGNWTASGTVWIGEYTIVENAALSYSTGTLTGSGLVSLMTTSNGSQRTVLFQDRFTVNTGTGVLTPQAASGYQFSLNNLVGFKVNQNLYQLSLDAKKGVLSGNLNLSLVIPNNVVAKTLSFTLDHTGAVTGSLADLTVFSLGQVSLTVKKATLASNGLTLTDAALQLPAGLGGASATLTAQDARITGDGQFLLTSGSAAVAFPNIEVGGTSGFGIEGATVTLAVSNGVFTFHGEGAFRLPGLTPGGPACKLDTAFTFASAPPPVRNASLTLSGCVQIPIGTTGFFITSVGGTVTLDASTTAVDLTLGIDGGPDLPVIGPAISGTVGGHWDNSWAVGLSGNLKVFSWQAGNASLTLSATSGLVGTLHLSYLGVFDEDGQIHVWKDTSGFHFTGDGSASVQFKKGSLVDNCLGLLCVVVPWADITGPAADAQLGEFRTPDAASVYGIKGVATITDLFNTWHPAFFVDFNGNFRADLNGLTQYTLINQSSTSQRRTATSAGYPVTVGATPALIVAVAYDSGSPTVTLTDPNGRTIIATTSAADVTYSTATGQVMYTVTNPVTGTWQVTVGNLTGSEHFLVNALGAQSNATITQAPSLTSTTNGYTITTQATGATGATYSLYYDTNNTGSDGKPIATKIPVTQTQVAWDTRTVPNGAYFVYALLDDLPSAPAVAYSASSVTIHDTTPPAVPTSVQATATGSDATVTWQASPDVDVAGYHIAYQQPGNGQTLTLDVPGGQQTSATLHGLDSNGNWLVSLSAYDINGNESAKSTPISLAVSAVKTFSLTSTTGGTASANPPANSYAPGTPITLTATPAAGYIFTGWTVDGADGGTTNPLVFTVTGSHAVIANFGPLPTIASVAPATGAASGGASVTISGSGFIAPTTVTFDGLGATTIAVSADGTQVTVAPPAHALGAVGIAVTTPLGSVTQTNAYTYAAPGVLPSPKLGGPPAGTANPLPQPRPGGPAAPGGTPAPLPPSRP